MESKKTKISSKTRKVMLASAMTALALAVSAGTIFVLSKVNGNGAASEEVSGPDWLFSESSPITYDDSDGGNGADGENGENENGENGNDERSSAEVKAEDIPNMLPKTTKENYTEAEVAVTKKISTTEKIAFSTTTTNEANLPKGKTVVSQKGVDGEKKITYLVKYNSKGESLAIEKVSEEITKKPTTEIKKVGTSDFNLNEKLTVSTYASGVCLSSDTDANGCKRASESYSFATAFELSKVFYVTQIQADDGTKTLFSKVSGGNFSYGGKSWFFETRYLKSKSELSESFCKTYGFACGRW